MNNDINKNISVTAFENIFKCYYRDVFRIVYHYVMNRIEAEDIVQDVFMKYIDVCDTIADDIDKKSYLFMLAKHHCVDYFRHRKVVDEHNLKLFESILNSKKSEYDTTYDELADKLQLSLDSLTTTQRKIITLKLEGKSYEAISDEMGISYSKVHKSITKAYTVIKSTIQSLLIGLF